jgi:hypothetical protein
MQSYRIEDGKLISRDMAYNAPAWYVMDGRCAGALDVRQEATNGH